MSVSPRHATFAYEYQVVVVLQLLTSLKASFCYSGEYIVRLVRVGFVMPN